MAEAGTAKAIYLTPEDWTRTQSELQALRAFKADQEKMLEAKEHERIKAIADSGQLNEALTQLRSNYESKLAKETSERSKIEREWLDERRDASINEALAGRAFAGVDPSRTAAMVRRLLRDEIEAVRDESGVHIRDKKTMRAVNDYLKERLEDPELAVFFGATHKGGAGTNAAQPAGGDTKQPGGWEDFAAAYRKRREAAQNGVFLPG